MVYTASNFFIFTPMSLKMCMKQFHGGFLNLCRIYSLGVVLCKNSKVSNFSTNSMTPKNWRKIENLQICFRNFVCTHMNLPWLSFQEDLSKNRKVIRFFRHFGPQVYPRGSLVIALVRPWSFRWSVKYLRDRSKDFINFLHEVRAP